MTADYTNETTSQALIRFRDHFTTPGPVSYCTLAKREIQYERIAVYYDGSDKPVYRGSPVNFPDDKIPAWMRQVKMVDSTSWSPLDGHYKLSVTEDQQWWADRVDWTPMTAAQIDAGDMPALYRFFDAAGRLLYVGQSKDPGSRFKQHERDKHWFPDVAEIRIERVAAELIDDLEREAIRDEHPLHNIQHNG